MPSNLNLWRGPCNPDPGSPLPHRQVGRIRPTPYCPAATDRVAGGVRRNIAAARPDTKIGDFTICGSLVMSATQNAGPSRMGWFRSNRGVVAWVALFALACQLVLSFGHLHTGKFSNLSGDSLAFAAVETGDGSADGPPSSPEKKPTGLAVDFCAICASVNLAGTLVLPILAIILTPRLFTEILPWSLAATEPASLDHRPFSARGPPHA